MQPISALFSLSQSRLPDVLAQVRSGKTLAVDLYDSRDAVKIASGQLVSVDNQIDVATGTVKLRARFVNAAEKLLPNAIVQVRLRVRPDHRAVIIPASALSRGPFGAFISTVAERSEEPRQGKTG